MDYIQSTASLRSGYLEVLRLACDDVNTPYARRVKRELNRNYVRMDAIKLDIRDYDCPISLLRDRQLQALVTKCPDIPTLDDPQDNCLKTFYKFEEQCWHTNKAISSGRLYNEPDVSAVIYTARRKIEKTLGRLPRPEDLSFAFGPGAARSVSRRTSAFDKFNSNPECTLAAGKDVIRLLSSTPALWELWGGTDKSFPMLHIVRGSRFGQVPKDAKTNRPIDIEPLLNSVLQKGYGSIIRNRLARSGNCIRSGQWRHNLLAKEASITKDLATVDKSGASDSIAHDLVMHLLPSDWFEALDNARSHVHEINGSYELLNKFSAMGNGFTFELETLIFLALARSCCDHLGLSGGKTTVVDPATGDDIEFNSVSVYGDDVILPCAALDLYLKVCDACGFTINTEKSYWKQDGFRESCGADWFNGVDVRVAYMRHAVTPHYLTTLHNRLYELGTCWLIPEAFRRLRELVPKRFRRFGPPSDHKYGYLFSDDNSKSVKAICIRPKKHKPHGRATMVLALYNTQFLGAPLDPWESKRTVDMARFTRRNDFTLSTRLILSSGELSSR